MIKYQVPDWMQHLKKARKHRQDKDKEFFGQLRRRPISRNSDRKGKGKARKMKTRKGVNEKKAEVEVKISEVAKKKKKVGKKGSSKADN